MKKNHKRISAAVLSLALGFSVAGAPALAPMAVAQATDQTSTIDTTRSASLTIEKYRGFPTNEDPIQLPGMAAEFTIAKVNTLDLTKQEDWGKVNTLLTAVKDGTSVEDALDASELNLGTPAAQTTAENGDKYTTTFSDLELGLYLVTETPQPGYQEAAPFFVTLPYVDTDGTGWNYELTVKPKNQDDTRVEKTVEDTLATLGSTSTYTIKMAIPDEEGLASVRVRDELPRELGNLTNVKVYHTEVTEGNEVTFNGGNTTDKILDLLIDDPTALALLKDSSLIVTFDAQIIALPTPDGEDRGGVIENDANVEITIDGVTYTYETDPEDPTETKLGELTITKQGYFEEALGTIEEGTAEFELWRCTDQEGDGQWKLGAGPLTMITDEVPQTKFETVSGVATIKGVQMANFVNDTQLLEADGDTLCVVETQAPAGYVLNPEPQPVLNIGEDYTMSVDVINLDDTIDGQLPSTGGMGTMAMIAAGLLVAVAGGFAALRGNRARG